MTDEVFSQLGDSKKKILMGGGDSFVRLGDPTKK